MKNLLSSVVLLLTALVSPAFADLLRTKPNIILIMTGRHPVNAPHGPFIAPEKKTRRFTDLGFGKEQAGFRGVIENNDENVGRLLARLDEWKLDENTLAETADTAPT